MIESRLQEVVVIVCDMSCLEALEAELLVAKLSGRCDEQRSAALALPLHHTGDPWACEYMLARNYIFTCFTCLLEVDMWSQSR